LIGSGELFDGLAVLGGEPERGVGQNGTHEVAGQLGLNFRGVAGLLPGEVELRLLTRDVRDRDPALSTVGVITVPSSAFTFMVRVTCQSTLMPSTLHTTSPLSPTLGPSG